MVTIRFLSFIAFFLIVAQTAATASALEVQEARPQGEVRRAHQVHHDGEAFGVLLAIDRLENAAPISQLIVADGTDMATWPVMQLPDAPTAMAIGDVTGDGNDEVAIVHALGGPECQQTGRLTLPCGEIRIYRAGPLRVGQTDIVANVTISPQATPCQPTNQVPASLALHDVTGDGRADLSIGQTGQHAGSCGVATLLDGAALQGTASLDDACWRATGDIVPENAAPEQFAARQAMGTTAGTPWVAIAAPYADSPNHQLAGRVALYDLSGACDGTEANPTPVAQHFGTIDSQFVGMAMEVVGDEIWVGAKGGFLMLSAPDLSLRDSMAIDKPLPIQETGDMDGDGVGDVMVGHHILSRSGQIIMNFAHFAMENIRAVAVTSDHVVTSDKFGSRIWSVTDLREPLVRIGLDNQRLGVGSHVNITILDVIRVIDVKGTPTWSVSGGTIVQSTPTSTQVRADAEGALAVRISIGTHDTMVRIPVGTPDATPSLHGPDAAVEGETARFVVKGHGDGTIGWRLNDDDLEGDADDAPEVRMISMASAGTHRITATVTQAGGETTTLHQNITVLRASLGVDGPRNVQQGDTVSLRPTTSPSAPISWHVSLPDGTMLQSQQPNFEFVSTSAGQIDVLLQQLGPDETIAAVGQAKIEVENRPPRIDELRIHNGYGIEGFRGSASASDPGGDFLIMEWFVDGDLVGRGLTLDMPDAKPGERLIEVKVIDPDGLVDTTQRRITLLPTWTPTPDADGSARAARGEADDTGDTTVPQHDAARATDRSLPAPYAYAAAIMLLASARILRRNRAA